MDYISYCQRLYKLHELQEFDAQGDIASALSALSNHLSLSLRQIEKVFTAISLFLVAWGKNGQPNLAIVSFLATTKVMNQALYNSIKSSKSKWDDIDAFFNFPTEEKIDRNSRALSRISDWIKCCVFTDAEYNDLDTEDEIRRLSRYFSMYERNQVIPAYCRYMDFAKIAG